MQKYKKIVPPNYKCTFCQFPPNFSVLRLLPRHSRSRFSAVRGARDEAVGGGMGVTFGLILIVRKFRNEIFVQLKICVSLHP